MAKIKLFEHDNYGGQSFEFTSEHTNFNNISASGLRNNNFNDETSSIIVQEGRWSLFEHSDFNGVRWEVHDHGGPNGDGRYPSSGHWENGNDPISSNDQISSIRPI